jgi:hypothetical protein
MCLRRGIFLSCSCIELYLGWGMITIGRFHRCSLLDISLSFGCESIYYLVGDFLGGLLLMLTWIPHSSYGSAALLFLLFSFFGSDFGFLFHLEFYFLECPLIVVTYLFLHENVLLCELLHSFLALCRLFCYLLLCYLEYQAHKISHILIYHLNWIIQFYFSKSTAWYVFCYLLQ